MGEAKVILTAEDKASTIIDGVTRHLGMFSKEGLGLGITLAVVNKALDMVTSAISDQINKALDYEVALVNVENVLSDMDQHLLPEITANITRMSEAYGESSIQLLGSFEYIKRAGYSVGSTLQILDAVQQLRVAHSLQEEEATQLVVQTMKVYGSSALDVTHVTEDLHNVMEQTTMSAGDLASMMTTSGASMAEYGVSIDEFTSLLEFMSSKGFADSSRTSRNLLAVMNSLTQPSDDVKKIFQESGLVVNEYTVKMDGLVGTIKRIEEATGGTSIFYKIFGSGPQTAMAISIASGIDDIDSKIQENRTSVGQLQEDYSRAAGTMRQTFAKIGAGIDEVLQGRTATAMNTYIEQATAERAQTHGWMGHLLGTDEDWNAIRDRAIQLAQNAMRELQQQVQGDYAKSLSSLIIDQTSTMEGMQQSRQAATTDQATAEAAKTKLETTHRYNEALHYMSLSLLDTSYAQKIFDKDTRDLVVSIKQQRDAIQSLEDKNNEYALASEKNSLAEMRIQLAGMNQRHGLTRSQENQLKQLQKQELVNRIKTMENQIQIDTIKENGLTEEERRLELIKAGYQEQLYTAADTYAAEHQALVDRIDADLATEAEMTARIGSWDQPNTILGQRYLAQKAYYNAVSNIGGSTAGSSYWDFNRSRAYGTYASGTDYVPRTGPYILHQGERVTPAGNNVGGDTIVYNVTINAMQKLSRDELRSLLASASDSRIVGRGSKVRTRTR